MFGRLTEKFRQNLGVGSAQKDWKPTSNARNVAMEKEVRKFAQELKAFHKAVKNLSDAITSEVGTFKAVLLAKLPKAFDEQPDGALTPLTQGDNPIGLNVQTEQLGKAVNDTHQSLTQKVVEPLEQWLIEYRKTKASNIKLEEMRLDLDEKRRGTLTLQEKYQKFKDTNHKDTEATLVKLQGEEDKMNRLAKIYADKEAEVFSSFVMLIRDSEGLRNFVASALDLAKIGFTEAHAAFGPPPAPLLNYTPPEPAAAISGGGAPPGGYLEAPPGAPGYGAPPVYPGAPHDPNANPYGAPPAYPGAPHDPNTNPYGAPPAYGTAPSGHYGPPPAAPAYGAAPHDLNANPYTLPPAYPGAAPAYPGAPPLAYGSVPPHVAVPDTNASAAPYPQAPPSPNAEKD